MLSSRNALWQRALLYLLNLLNLKVYPKGKVYRWFFCPRQGWRLGHDPSKLSKLSNSSRGDELRSLNFIFLLNIG